MTHRTPYTARIEALAPRHCAGQVEAFMRGEHPTLDHLDAERFAAEVAMACICIHEAGPEMAQRIAASYGL